MFSQLRGKFSEAADKLRTLAADDADKAIAELITKSTSEDLIAPDWATIMSLVDFVNQNPSVMYEKLVKALRRNMAKPNAKCQLLTLTILETCVKNCYAAFYSVLSKSELWLELMKMAADTSVGRVDAEVRDKILCLAEDYAKVLPPQEFRESYESLLERGIDFPLRGPDDQPPILTPPLLPPNSSHDEAALAAAGFADYSSAVAGQQQATPGSAADPFAGMSDEDKLAVQAAMAEIDQEERAVRQSAAVAASTAMFQQMNLQQPLQQQQQRAAGQPAPGTVSPVAPAAQHRAAPNLGLVLPENVEEALQAVSNTTALLNEMLASEADPRDSFVSEIAEQCVRMRSKLEETINGLTDEAQLASALTQHEALHAVICKFDEHLARVEQGSTVAPPAAGLLQRPVESLQGAPAGTQVLPLDALAAGANFTLLGDDDEEGGGEMLNSKRTAHVADAAHPPATSSQPPVDLEPTPSLIDFDAPAEQLQEPAGVLQEIGAQQHAGAPLHQEPLI